MKSKLEACKRIGPSLLRMTLTGKIATHLTPRHTHLANGRRPDGMRKVKTTEELISGHIELPRQHRRYPARGHGRHVVVKFAVGWGVGAIQPQTKCTRKVQAASPPRHAAQDNNTTNVAAESE